MKKWLILAFIILIGIGGILFRDIFDYKKTDNISGVLDAIPLVDTVLIKKGGTKEEVMKLTSSAPYFSDIVEIYKLPYVDLKLGERKLLNKKPIMEVDYLADQKKEFTVSIYIIKENEESIVQSINERISSSDNSYKYTYSPTNKNSEVIFALKDNNQLLGINEGLKDLADKIIFKSRDN